MRSEQPGVQLAGAVVVLAASLPHAKVRRTIRSLHVEHEVLHERHFVRREDNLHHHRLTQLECSVPQCQTTKLDSPQSRSH